MPTTQESTRSLLDLWQNSRHLLSSITAYRGREALLRQEARGLTESVEAIEIPGTAGFANDPRITRLETALREAIPLLKANCDLNLFEEWLVGDEPNDGSDTPF